MQMTLRGNPPDRFLSAILSAGFQAGSSPEVVLQWMDDATPPEPGSVALAPDTARFEAALGSTAAAVVLASTPGALTLQLTRWRQQQQNLTQLRSERRSFRGSLRATEKLNEELLRTADQPIIGADHDGKIVTFSASAEELLGYSSAYACSQMHVSDIYANPTEARRVLAEIRCSPDGYLRRFPVRVRARSGEQIPVYLSATEILSDPGGPAHTIGFLTDRRSDLALRERLEDASQQVLSSERRASGINATRVAIHELNQPLTALMGTVELLDLRPDVTDEVRERLGRMYDQLDRMAEIVRGLGGGIKSKEPT